MAERPIEDLRAYECYLRAKEEIWRCSADALDRGIRYLQDALELVGPNAHLYAGLALAHFQRVNLGLAQEEAIAAMQDYVSKALALDPESSTALTVQGMSELAFQGNVRESIRLLKRALAVNPDEPDALLHLPIAFGWLSGRVAAARPLVERLAAVDPLSATTYVAQGAAHFWEGGYDMAVRPWRRGHERYPESPMYGFFYALGEAYRGDHDSALAILDRLRSEDPNNATVRFCRILEHTLLGNKDKALGELTPEFRATVARDPMWGHFLAATLAYVGAEDEALDMLEQAVNVGFINYPMMAAHDPFLAKLRGNVRFERLLARVKREWEAFEA
jgi:tetratricopeptide (TPR) repeat protein